MPFIAVKRLQDFLSQKDRYQELIHGPLVRSRVMPAGVQGHTDMLSSHYLKGTPSSPPTISSAEENPHAAHALAS
jgi:hypothetical protein